MWGVIVPPSKLIVAIFVPPKGGFLIRGVFLLRGGDYMCMYVYIYIYIYIYVHTYICVYVLYICIYRERESERYQIPYCEPFRTATDPYHLPNSVPLAITATAPYRDRLTAPYR